MQINYSTKYAPTLSDFMQDNTFIRAVMGCFGSGKSACSVNEIVRRSVRQYPDVNLKRKTRYACIRNTFTELEDTTLKTFDEWIPLNDPRVGKYNKTEHIFVSNEFPLPDGTTFQFEVLFRALDQPKHIRKLLSLELTGAFLNEARDIPLSIVNGVQGRVGRYPSKKTPWADYNPDFLYSEWYDIAKKRIDEEAEKKGIPPVYGGASWFGVWMDTNPPDDDSWWYRLFEEIKPSNAILYKQPSGLSPDAENLPYLPPNYYENLMQGKDSEWIKVYIKGEYGYVQDGKPVYPDYSDTLHCKEFDIPDNVTIYRGWDFGLTPSCSYSFINAFGQWCVIDELVSDNMGIERFSDQVIAHSITTFGDRKYIDVGDPAGEGRSQVDERTCFDILFGKNINIMAGDQDPNIRIESVKYPLNRLIEGKPQFLLHPRCKMLRKGFNGKYKYRRLNTAQERYVDKPDKNEYSHIHDALQYTATYLFANRLRGVPEYTPEKNNLIPTFDDLLNTVNSNARKRL